MDVETDLGIFDNFVTTELALPINPVNKAYWAFSDLETHCFCPDHHLHLKSVALAFSTADDRFEDFALVESEAAGQITNAWIEDSVRQQIGSPGYHLPFQIPAVYAPIASVTRAGHDIIAAFLLLLNHRG